MYPDAQNGTGIFTYMSLVKNSHMNKGKWLGKYSLHGASGVGLGQKNQYQKIVTNSQFVYLCAVLRDVPSMVACDLS